MSLASTLIAMREIKRLSQAELARMTGITPANLNRMEKGKSMPSVPAIKALCEALNCGPHVLLEMSQAHPTECEHCRGTGVRWARQRGGISLRAEPKPAKATP